MLSSTSARGPQVSPLRFPELEAAASQPQRQLRTRALPRLPGPGPARRGPAAGWEDVGGAPIPKREASEGGGKKGGAAGEEEEEGKKEREREREGRRRCGRAEEKGGREGERSRARKLGEFGIRAEGPEPETPLLLRTEYLASLPDGIPVRTVSNLQCPSPRPSPRFTAAVQRSLGAAAGEPATAGTYGEQGYLARAAGQRGPRRILGGRSGGGGAALRLWPRQRWPFFHPQRLC